MKRFADEWLGRMNRVWKCLVTCRAARRAEAELRGLGARELHDLGLERGGITFAARHGRG